MSKKIKKTNGWGFEAKILIVLLVLFGGVLVAAWGTAMKLRQTIAANAAVMDIDPSALIEVERLRSLAEGSIVSSRSFFLLGSRAIFDKQREEKRLLLDSLAKFEKQYDLPQMGQIVKDIVAIQAQEQDFFSQGMEFREKQTESKIVAQFYNSKTNPLISQFNAKFAEIANLHNAELERSRARAREAGLTAQAQIPKNMTTLTFALGVLFLAMAFLIVRMLVVRSSHLRERDRLVEEAKKAILSRDEVITAVSQDFKEPLQNLSEISEHLAKAQTPNEVIEEAGFVKSTAAEIQAAINDIYDQKNSDMGSLTLRLDQLEVSDLLEEAQFMLQPIAKKRSITLQVDPLNQSTLAYFDRERVLRVLLNLVGNSIKFSRKHEKVSIKAKVDAQFVNVSVIDNGPGIPDSQIATIFDNFWQARSTADQGAGVGLAVVKTIIEAHGGSVRADKNPLGQGTVFTFSLPRRRPVGAQIKKPSTSVVKRSSSTKQGEASL